MMIIGTSKAAAYKRHMSSSDSFRKFDPQPCGITLHLNSIGRQISDQRITTVFDRASDITFHNYVQFFWLPKSNTETSHFINKHRERVKLESFLSTQLVHAAIVQPPLGTSRASISSHHMECITWQEPRRTENQYRFKGPARLRCVDYVHWHKHAATCSGKPISPTFQSVPLEVQYSSNISNVPFGPELDSIIEPVVLRFDLPSPSIASRSAISSFHQFGNKTFAEISW